MAQGGLKATTTVVGPFEKGIVDRCLTRLKHHCIIALFSGSLSIPGRPLGDASRNYKGIVLKEYVYLRDASFFTGLYLNMSKIASGKLPIPAHYGMFIDNCPMLVFRYNKAA